MDPRLSGSKTEIIARPYNDLRMRVVAVDKKIIVYMAAKSVVFSTEDRQVVGQGCLPLSSTPSSPCSQQLALLALSTATGKRIWPIMTFHLLLLWPKGSDNRGSTVYRTPSGGQQLWEHRGSAAMGASCIVGLQLWEHHGSAAMGASWVCRHPSWVCSYGSIMGLQLWGHPSLVCSYGSIMGLQLWEHHGSAAMGASWVCSYGSIMGLQLWEHHGSAAMGASWVCSYGSIMGLQLWEHHGSAAMGASWVCSYGSIMGLQLWEHHGSAAMGAFRPPAAMLFNVSIMGLSL